jgi:hypothetical protein
LPCPTFREYKIEIVFLYVNTLYPLSGMVGLAGGEEIWYKNGGKEIVEANESLKKLMRDVGEASRFLYAYHVVRFCDWARTTPDELLAKQRESRNSPNDGEYAIHDKIKEFIATKKSAGYKRLIVASIRSFFIVNRCELKKEKYVFTGEGKPDVDLTLAEANSIISAAREPFKTIFQMGKYGAMDEHRIILMNRTMWDSINQQLSKPSRRYIRLDFTKRKNNPRKFFTLIPREILENCPKPFLTTQGNLMNGNNIRQGWRSAKRRAGVKKPVGAHELRDLFSTEWTKAELSEKVGEFLMGHNVDPNSYKKFCSDEDFVGRIYSEFIEHIEGRGKINRVEEQNKTLTEQLQKQAAEIAKLNSRFEVLLREKA